MDKSNFFVIERKETFIISSEGVKKEYSIKHPVFIYNLAPTVGWLFGFELNEWITGKPVIDVFTK